ncbi:MAG: Na+/H+ antiporter subunit E [Nitrosomonas sp.]|nr:Na+/H+ antiporter subunit E [Nitrosomonas sp.]MDP1951515.1 Na+/H+ antiporter subunit E [Nitrosomonas sp.]
MRRLLPHPLLTPILAGIWLLLSNSVNPGQIVLGLLLGWAIPLLSIHFWPDKVYIYKPLTLLRYMGVLLIDMVLANFTVARLILGNPGRLKPAFIVLPLTLTSDLAISILAISITLTPGTVSAQLSPDRKHLLIHALNETDADALIVTIKRRYEIPLKEVFEKC